MSEDKIKKTPLDPKHQEVKTVYDSYQEHKYNDWANKITNSKQRYTISGQANPDPSKPDDYVVTENGTVSPQLLGVEQTAFEKYLAKANATGFKVIYYDDNKKDLDIFKSGANQLRYTFKIRREDVNAIEVGDSVLLYINTDKINDYENMSMTIYGKVLEKDTSNNRVVLKTDGWSTGHKPKQTMIVKYDGDADTFENLKNKANSRDAINFIIKDKKILGLLEKNAGHGSYDNIIFQIPADKISNKNFPMTIYGTFQRWNGLTNQLYINPKGYSTGSDEGTAPIPVPPSPGGGGARPELIVPADDLLDTIKGKYGMNFFNFRDLSNNRLYGITGNTFYNKKPQHAESSFDTGDLINSNERLVRIRKNHKINAKIRLINTDAKGSNNIQLSIAPQSGHGTQIHFDWNVQGSDKILRWKDLNNTPNDYSYGLVTFGTQGGTESKSKMQVRAWYGDIEPKGVLDQRFVFNKFNGYTLRALQKFNASSADEGLLEDEYKIYKRHTSILKNVNIFKLKDAKQWYIGKHQSKDAYVLLIPIPDDCDEGTNYIMSNNLCDISANEADASLQMESKPFFVRDIAPSGSDILFDDIERVLPDNDEILIDENGKPIVNKVQKNCFQILISSDYIEKWAYLLKDTEILYKLHDVKETQIPVGGQIYTLESGEQVYTCLYKTVEAGKKQTGSSKYVIDFKDSPFGAPDRSILFDNIVEVIDNTGYVAP